MAFIINKLYDFTENELAQTIGVLRVYKLESLLATQTTKLSNSIFNKFSKNKRPVESVEERLAKEVISLSHYPKETLISLMINEITKRITGLTITSGLDDLVADSMRQGTHHIKLRLQSDAYLAEKWEKHLIDFISEYKKFDMDLPYRRRADMIVEAVGNENMARMQKMAKKQSSREQKATEEAMDKVLKDLPEHQRQALKETFNLNELSGKTMRRVLASMGPVALGNLGGFGTYMALSTLMHTVFTTMLQITLPFAAYTSAAGAMSVFLGPVGLLASFAWGSWKITKDRKKLSADLLSNIFSDIALRQGKTFMPSEESLSQWTTDAALARKIHVDTTFSEAKVIIQGNKLVIDRDEWERVKKDNKEKADLREKIATKELNEEFEQLKQSSVSKEELENIVAAFEVKMDTVRVQAKHNQERMEAELKKAEERQAKELDKKNKEIQAYKNEHEKKSRQLSIAEEKNRKHEQERIKDKAEKASLREQLARSKKENEEKDRINKEQARVNKEQAEINKKLQSELDNLHEQIVVKDNTLLGIKNVLTKFAQQVGAPIDAVAGWDDYEKLLFKALQDLQDAEIKKDKNKEKQKEKLRLKLKKRYDRLDDESINQLQLGEFLFNNHKDSEYMDFSFMLMSYGKCLENVLKRYLYLHKEIGKDDKRTLGNLVLVLEERLNADRAALDKLNKFVEIRNNAVHDAKGINRKLMLKARNLLFNMDDEINGNKYILDYIYRRMYC